MTEWIPYKPGDEVPIRDAYWLSPHHHVDYFGQDLRPVELGSAVLDTDGKFSSFYYDRICQVANVSVKYYMPLVLPEPPHPRAMYAAT